MSLKYEPASEPLHSSVQSKYYKDLPAPFDVHPIHPGGNPGAKLKSISHRCHLILVAFVWELTKETIQIPLGCLQAGYV